MTGMRPLALASWYPDAKRAVRKELAIAPEYGRFLRRFEGRFGFAPVWVAQVEDHGQAKTCVVVDRSADARMFRPDQLRPVTSRR